MSTKKKLVITCKTLPPLVIGSTILMTNLFSSYPGHIEAIAGWEYGAKIDPSFTSPYQTHYLKFKYPFIQRVLDKYKRIYFFIIKWFVYFKLKELKPDAVFAACTPDGLFYTASFIACRKLNIPFWGHIHDLWIENTRPETFQEKLAKKWEPRIMQEADKIYCMTENQVVYYSKKYTRNFEVIPHCIDSNINSTQIRSYLIEKGKDEDRVILYTGNISHAMNLDAMKTFIQCIDDLPANYKVKILTSLDIESIKRLNIFHPRANYDWVSIAETKELLKYADILFLPLSFKNCVSSEVRTVFATKTLDYLVSGRPILVFSPAWSFHSISAYRNGWGYIADRDDPPSLANAIIELASNRYLQHRIVNRAIEEAKRRHAGYYANYLYKQIETSQKSVVSNA